MRLEDSYTPPPGVDDRRLETIAQMLVPTAPGSEPSEYRSKRPEHGTHPKKLERWYGR